MDANKLNTGEKVAGISGIVLLVFMWLLTWFSVDIGGDAFGVDIDTGANAWQSFGGIDFVLFLAAVMGIALAVVAATQTEVNVPVALSAVTAGLGLLAVLLVLFRIISPPEVGFGVDADRGIGVFLGLIAAAGVAAGGWMAMQEEGSSYTAPSSAGDAPPPPPPPPAQ